MSQFVAVSQCVATCCTVLHSVVMAAVCCNELQCAAVCCSVLQCVAMSAHCQKEEATRV